MAAKVRPGPIFSAMRTRRRESAVHYGRSFARGITGGQALCGVHGALPQPPRNRTMQVSIEYCTM